MTIRSKAIRNSARGEVCQVRIPGHCNGNPETTVLAHLNGGGMGMKKSDLHAAYCCFNCHQVLDGVVKTEYPSPILELWHRQGVERTQDLMIDKRLLVTIP